MNRKLIYLNLYKKISNYKLLYFLNQFEDFISKDTDIILICNHFYISKIRRVISKLNFDLKIIIKNNFFSKIQNLNYINLEKYHKVLSIEIGLFFNKNVINELFTLDIDRNKIYIFGNDIFDNKIILFKNEKFNIDEILDNNIFDNEKLLVNFRYSLLQILSIMNYLKIIIMILI